jgi:hypothetical protein
VLEMISLGFHLFISLFFLEYDKICFSFTCLEFS